MVKVVLDEAQLVASWTWNCNDDACGICRHPFDTCCSDCKLPGDDCPVVWGKCSHSFHLHCILTWTNVEDDNPVGHRHKCPLCRRPWEFQRGS